MVFALTGEPLCATLQVDTGLNDTLVPRHRLEDLG
jgi:hypothetical protein